MALIYAAAALGAVLFGASLVLLQKKSAPPQAGALAVLREAPVTVIFAPFLLAVAILLVAARQMDISVGGAGDSAVLMTAALVLICAAGSGYILLFTYVRRAVAYPDRLELQSALGKTHSVRWQDIVEVKTTVTSKRVTLRTAKETVSVNGDPRHYRAFVQQLYEHVPAHVGSDTLGQLLQRLN
ncbi:MAG: hypothetical protein ACLVEL_02120 [Ruthenibacterium sp.]|jgi:hypothetical protein